MKRNDPIAAELTIRRLVRTYPRSVATTRALRLMNDILPKLPPAIMRESPDYRALQRAMLGLEPGDLVGYVVADGGVRLERVAPFDAAYHAAISEALEEWASPEDDEAFGDL